MMQMHDTLHQAIVHLDKNETSRVILLLDHVEARNARLLHAVTGVIRGRLFKSLDHVRLDVYVNMNNQHFRPPYFLGRIGWPICFQWPYLMPAYTLLLNVCKSLTADVIL